MGPVEANGAAEVVSKGVAGPVEPALTVGGLSTLITLASGLRDAHKGDNLAETGELLLTDALDNPETEDSRLPLEEDERVPPGQALGLAEGARECDVQAPATADGPGEERREAPKARRLEEDSTPWPDLILQAPGHGDGEMVVATTTKNLAKIDHG